MSSFPSPNYFIHSNESCVSILPTYYASEQEMCFAHILLLLSATFVKSFFLGKTSLFSLMFDTYGETITINKPLKLSKNSYENVRISL